VISRLPTINQKEMRKTLRQQRRMFLAFSPATFVQEKEQGREKRRVALLLNGEGSIYSFQSALVVAIN